MGSIRLVTITTDASFHPAYKVGAYAYWIMCDSGKLFSYGVLKGKVETSQEAELMSVVKAIHHLKVSNWQDIQRIIINTDCMPVIHLFDGTMKKKKAREPLEAIQQHYYSQLTATKFLKTEIEFRHVKAHSGIGTARQFCNDWCDRAAKKAMREAVALLPKINHND